MDNPVYGVVHNDAHMDVSNTLLGAKQYATRNGYEEVSKRVGYNAVVIARKTNGKWEDYPLPF